MIYRYKCNACEHTWDAVASMANCDLATTEPCPNCEVVGEVNHFFDYAIPTVPDTILGVANKLPADYREFLRDLKKANPDGYVRDR